MDIIDLLIGYAEKNNLIKSEDRIYCKNTICSLIHQENPLEIPRAIDPEEENIDKILAPILELAVENGVLPSIHPDYADSLDTALMGCLLSRPSSVQAEFERISETKGTREALSYFYNLSIDINYVRMNRIKKNFDWISPTPCGDLQITINLSKPEKDPKAIALAKIQEQNAVKYPPCVLCKENVGFAGTSSHPARNNLRTVEMEFANEKWHFQYSPYIYYPEHSILLAEDHRPMSISSKTFRVMTEFLTRYPEYFIGSNADLPIVGGSILSHDHFQAGFHQFPLNHAKTFETARIPNLDVEISLVQWPVSVVRLRSKKSEDIIHTAHILTEYWRGYSNQSLDILSQTTEPHNTVTPIGRMTEGGVFEFDLALRNNRISEKYPLGIFHPYPEYHNIKKENIGLIEVMGLAILPGRLMGELTLVRKYLVEKSLKAAETVPALAKHLAWMKDIAKAHQFNEDNVEKIVQDEVAKVFYRVLCNCGVFKEHKDFSAFLKNFITSVK
ncbi:MAG: UDP-glucose--hexose-1-phosphate uridylyltransferase [Brevinema sp.]